MYQAVHSLDTHPARPQPGLGHALCALTHMAHAHTPPAHRFTYRWLVHTRLVHIHSLTVGSCTQAQGPGLPPLPPYTQHPHARAAYTKGPESQLLFTQNLMLFIGVWFTLTTEYGVLAGVRVPLLSGSACQGVPQPISCCCCASGLRIICAIQHSHNSVNDLRTG